MHFLPCERFSVPASRHGLGMQPGNGTSCLGCTSSLAIFLFVQIKQENALIAEASKDLLP